MTTDEIRQLVDRLVHKVVDEWWQLSTADPYTEVYLFYKQGDATASASNPEGYELGMPERLSPAWTCEQCAMRVRDALRRLPILPPDKTCLAMQ